MKKKILALILATIILISFAACATPSSEDGATATTGEDGQTAQTQEAEDVTLKMLAIPFYETWILEAFDRFTQSDPMYANYKLELETVPFAQLFETIEIKVSNNDSDYDLLFVDGPVVSAYGLRGYLYPLDDYYTEEELSDVLDSSMETSYYNGQLLALGIEGSGSSVIYNKDLFDEAGIEYPSSSKDERMTWEEVEAMGIEFMEKVNPDRNNGKWFYTFHQVSRPYDILTLPNSMGGQSIGDDSITVDGVINTDEWVQSMQFYQDMFNEYAYSPKGVEAPATIDMFAAGNIAMINASFSYLETFEAGGFEMGVAYYPYFEDGEPAIGTDSWHLGINAFSEQPDKAAPFVKYVTTDKEGTGIITEVMNSVPILKSNSQLLIDLAQTDFEKEVLEVSIGGLEYGVPRPVTPGYREYELIMSETFEDIRNGADPLETLNSAVEKINRDLEQYVQ